MMMKILCAYDIPPKLLKAISSLYENTLARVVSPDGITDFFQVKKGVLQGDTLAPYLFAIVIDYLMRQVYEGNEELLGFQLNRRRSRRHPATYVTDIDFADDLALLTEEVSQAQELIDRLQKEASAVGLECNAKKTELQVFNHPDPVVVTVQCGRALKVVENFKYLGSWTKSSEDDFSVRKALAWSACHKLRKVWSSKLSRKIKIRLFTATVESVLLYGAETWSMTNTLKKKLDGCYTRMLRMALNVPWQSHTTNDRLYGDLPLVSLKVQQRRMRLAGHCSRHEEEIANKLLLWQPTEGIPSRGRRKHTFVDTFLDDVGVATVQELKSLMCDREEWKDRVKELGRPDGRPK